MDDIPVPEIVELSPSPGGPFLGAFGRAPRGFGEARPARALVVIAILIAGIVGGIRWGTFDGGVARPSPALPSTSGAAPSERGVVREALLHAWQRPYNVAPGPDDLGSGFLRIYRDSIAFGREPGVDGSTSSIAASGDDSLVVRATSETPGCTAGAVGTYRVVLAGKGTVLTLTASEPDGCTARETMLAGPWVRADFPAPVANELAPGTHRTTSFDPFGDSTGRGRLSYTVPTGWELVDDSRSVALLHRGPAASPDHHASEVFIVLIAAARVAEDYEDGATCGRTGDQPGVGGGLDDIVRAITTRPGVAVTRHEAVRIGGRAGVLLDLHIAKSWTGGCESPDGRFVAILLLDAPSAGGANIGLGPGQTIRLVLLELGGDRTLAVAVASPGGSPFDELVASAMPIIESFEFVRSVP